MTRKLIIIKTDADRAEAADRARTAVAGMRVEFKLPARSPEQSSLMWARLHDIADQLPWHGLKLTAEDYKDIFTAGLRRARIVPNIDGDGFVQLGLHTSDLTKEEMSNLLDLMDAFAAQHGVTFKEFTHSSDASTESPPGDRTDAPAASGPQPRAAGVSYAYEPSDKASVLKADWFEVYLQVMTRSTNRAMSVAQRDTKALALIGGVPNEMEREVTRDIARLTIRRDRGEIDADQFHAGIAAVRAGWAAAINHQLLQGEKSCADTANPGGLA